MPVFGICSEGRSRTINKILLILLQTASTGSPGTILSNSSSIESVSTLYAFILRTTELASKLPSALKVIRNKNNDKRVFPSPGEYVSKKVEPTSLSIFSLVIDIFNTKKRNRERKRRVETILLEKELITLFSTLL